MRKVRLGNSPEEEPRRTSVRRAPPGCSTAPARRRSRGSALTRPLTCSCGIVLRPPLPASMSARRPGADARSTSSYSTRFVSRMRRRRAMSALTLASAGVVVEKSTTAAGAGAAMYCVAGRAAQFYLAGGSAPAAAARRAQ